MIIVIGFVIEFLWGNCMNCFKLIVVLILLSCLFLLVCVIKVSVNISVLILSILV